MARGTVKWFNAKKGFGFIQPENGQGSDIFVHISALKKAGYETLNEGETISFELEENNGKTSAVELKIEK